MKVYMIGSKGIPAKSGGVERHIEEVATRLAQKGHEVFVYCRKNYTPEGLKEYKGVKLIHLPSIATKHLDAISRAFLATLDVLFRRADIIHYHAIGPSSLLWLPKLLKPRTKIMATFHCQDYFHEKWGFPARVYLRFGEMIACRVPHLTIAVSQTLKEYVRLTYGREAAYIPNGTNLPKTEDNQELARWNLKPQDYILYVGRLVRHKGVHDLISAYQDLKTNKKLVIVGNGKDSHTIDYHWELLQLAKNNSKILFLGEQIGKSLATLFSHAALFVSPSSSEGLSIALLEAMSYSLPVLISDIPENKEVMAGTGFVFKTGDVSDLKTKLAYMLANSQEAQEKGKQARERVASNYLWDRIVPQIEGAYTSVTETLEARAVTAAGELRNPDARSGSRQPTFQSARRD